jgi:hypothetical protein
MAFNKFNRGRGKTQAIVFGIITLIVVLIIVLLFRGSTYEGMNTTTPSRTIPSIRSNTGGTLIIATNPPIKSCRYIVDIPSGVNNCSNVTYATYADALIEPLTGGCILFDTDYKSGKSKLTDLSGLPNLSIRFTPTLTDKPNAGTTGTNIPNSVNGGDLIITSGSRSAKYTLVNPRNEILEKQPSNIAYNITENGTSYQCAQADMQPYFLLVPSPTNPPLK